MYVCTQLSYTECYVASPSTPSYQQPEALPFCLKWKLQRKCFVENEVEKPTHLKKTKKEKLAIWSFYMLIKQYMKTSWRL